jgi:hypothetical protein
MDLLLLAPGFEGSTRMVAFEKSTVDFLMVICFSRLA